MRNEQKPRLLGLDVGEKRIGVAVSDPLGWTAQGLPTIVRRSQREAIAEIAHLLEQYQTTTLVVGIPLDQAGNRGAQAQKVEQFVSALEAELQRRAQPLTIHWWDERHSTQAVERSMLEGDLSRAKRRKRIDQLSAVWILQGYLDAQGG